MNCFLALLLQQHQVLIDFMTCTCYASSKQLQETCEVENTALNCSYILSLVF